MKRLFISLSLVFLFLFIRFFNIDKSLFFFNDMGRDLFVLLEWLKTGKIPLLGPQTSALPINQSPIYYYFLMPFYLLSRESPYSALIMNSLVYILSFIFSLYLTRRDQLLNQAIFLSFILIIFHPQHILQNRYVWNPSLLPPFLVLSLILFLTKKPSYLVLSIFLVCLAISINYSAIPVLISYLVTIIFFRRKFFIKTLIISSVFLLILNLTTVIQLLKRLIINGYFWKSNQVFQIGSTFSQKFNDLITLAFGIKVGYLSFIFLIFIFSVTVVSFFRSKKQIIRVSSFIFLTTSVLTFFSPFNLQAHYIFGITSTLFVFICLLDWRLKIPIILFLLFFYLQPSSFASYFLKTPRTYQQMDACFKKFCSEFKSPLFVSVESNLYPYHFGPEHRYLMLKNGCDVKQIETQPKAANYMAVVLDNGSYSSETKYYELDLFGKHREIQRYSCEKNFGLVLLKRSTF